MKTKQILALFGIIIILSSIFLIVANQPTITGQVIKENKDIESNEKVKVIIHPKKEFNNKNKGFSANSETKINQIKKNKKTIEMHSGSFEIELTKKELDELMKSGEVEQIEPIRYFSTFASPLSDNNLTNTTGRNTVLNDVPIL